MATQVFVIFLAVLALSGCASSSTTVTDASTSGIRAHSEQFMAHVIQQPGIQTTASGLAYRVVKTGYGCRPTPNSAITILYEAQVAYSQKIVDSSYLRGKPDTYPLNRMILAWREALPMMTEGSTWELYVPPALAYGRRGAGPDIPPYSAMLFKVELLKAGTCALRFKRG